VKFAQVHRWHQDFNPVGHYRGLGRFRAACAAGRRVHLAGDYHSSPSLNSAASAGVLAAQNLLNANVIA
jgi:hypothetical protein